MQVGLLRHFAPQPGRDLRHGEVLLQAVIEHGERGLKIRGGEQRQRRAMEFFADLVVLGAVGDELAKPRFELVVFSRSVRICRSAMESRGPRAGAARRSPR
jgi:hypothetical protein